MLFEITHRTHYSYSVPVFLEPQRLRLQPRNSPQQTLRDFVLDVRPEPIGQAAFVDLDGNTVRRAWFEGSTRALDIVARSTVETHCTDPFNFLLEPWATSLPIRWPGFVPPQLSEALHRAQPSAAIDVLAAGLVDESGGVTTLCLTALARQIASRCRVVRRPVGEPHPADLTWAAGSGASRDLAALFIDTARALGIPARHVSGYCARPDEGARVDLHAWAEIYLPGTGWRGFDPSQGLAVTDRHVAIAAGATPRAAATVDGSYRGNGVTAYLDAEITLRCS